MGIRIWRITEGEAEAFFFETYDEGVWWYHRMQDLGSLMDDLQARYPAREASEEDVAEYVDRVLAWLNGVYEVSRRFGKRWVPVDLQSSANTLEESLYLDPTNWNDNERQGELPRVPTAREALRNAAERRAREERNGEHEP